MKELSNFTHIDNADINIHKIEWRDTLFNLFASTLNETPRLMKVFETFIKPLSGEGE